MSPFSRREFLKLGGVLGAAAAGGVLLPDLSGSASASTVRRPGSLPRPALPAGSVDGSMPFDHIVVVMMENHSFDNYLGMLPLAGTAHADGFTFDRSGQPTNSNPSATGNVMAFPFTSTAQGPDVTQLGTPRTAKSTAARWTASSTATAGPLRPWVTGALHCCRLRTRLLRHSR